MAHSFLSFFWPHYTFNVLNLDEQALENLPT